MRTDQEITLADVREMLAAQRAPHDRILPRDGTGSRPSLVEEFSAEIACHLPPGLHTTLWNLKVEAVYEHVLYGTPLNPTFGVLELIPNGTGTTLDRPNWAEALQFAAHLYHCLYPNGEDPEEIEHSYRRYFNAARAAKRLQQEGAVVRIQSGELKIVNERELGERIAHNASVLGKDLLYRLLEALGRGYDPVMVRYKNQRTFSPPRRDRSPRVPLGFLLNVAVRSFMSTEFPLVGDRNHAFRELRRLATDYVATHDIEDYTPVERMLFRPDGIIDLLRRTTGFDTCFSLPQMRLSHAIEILGDLFAMFSERECVQAWGGNISDVLEVCRAIAHIVDGRLGPRTFTASEVLDFIPGTSNAPAVLAVLSHPPRTANADLLLPFDCATFGLRPLLALEGGTFLLADPLWCAPSFYWALSQTLHGTGVRNVNRRIGDGVERAVREALRRRGISCHHGEYQHQLLGKRLECDCVIETHSTILILEIKKRPLSPEAQRGNNLMLFIDLAEGLLRPQLQSLYHEVQLRHTGELALPTGVVTLRERTVERIAITLNDYGTLHDREGARNFLTAILHGEVRAHASVDAKLDNLRLFQTKLREGVGELKNLGARNPEFFLPVAFLSVSQLLTVLDLDKVSSADDLGDALGSTRHVSSGTGDMLGDIAYWYLDGRSR